MIAIPHPRTLRRAAIDALFGLALFATLAFGMLGASSFEPTAANNAHAADLARVAAFTGPLSLPSEVETVAARPSINLSPQSASASGRGADVLLMAGLFAVLFSFNLAFIRHLRRVYAAPRRSRANRTP